MLQQAPIAPLRSQPPSAEAAAKADASPDGFDHGEQTARYANNFLVHLLVSDVPSVVTTAANYTPMPKSWSPALAAFNVINIATSGIALAADLRETHGTLKNPDASKLDKVLDVSHLVASDVVGTASGFIPFFANVHHPLAGALFIGGQALIVATDLAKAAYDIHRKGQQSVHHPVEEAPAIEYAA